MSGYVHIRKFSLIDGPLFNYVKIKMGFSNSDNEIFNRLICEICGFSIGRHEIHGRKNKYWGMKSKIIKHFHQIHPEIWQKLKEINKEASHE